MQAIRFRKINRSIIVIYLVIIAILIDSSTMYRYLVDSPLFGKGFGWALGVICLVYVIQAKKLIVDNTLKIRLPVLLLFLFIYALATGYDTYGYLKSYVGVFFVLFIFAYSLYQNGEMKSFFQAFSNIMLVMAIVSVFFWLFGSIMNVLPGRTQQTYYWASHYRTTYSYFNLYFENPIQNQVHGTMCNLGIFTESPGYSGFLIYALLIEMLFRKEIKQKRKKQLSNIKILIYIVTLITTNSTKGIIAVLIAFAIEYVSKESKSRLFMLAKIIVGFIVIGGVAYLGFVLVGSKLETGSGLIRLDDLRSGFLTFRQHPLFGVGYNNVQEIIKNQMRARSNQGLSMGLTVLLAYGGLWLFLFYVGAAFISFRSPYFEANRKAWFLVVLVLGYNLFVSNCAFSDPYIFVIAAAYAAPVKKLSNTRGYFTNAAA